MLIVAMVKVPHAYSLRPDWRDAIAWSARVSSTAEESALDIHDTCILHDRSGLNCQQSLWLCARWRSRLVKWSYAFSHFQSPLRGTVCANIRDKAPCNMPSAFYGARGLVSYGDPLEPAAYPLFY